MIWDYLFSSGSRSLYDDNNDDDDDVTIGFFLSCFFFEAQKSVFVRFGSVFFGCRCMRLVLCVCVCVLFVVDIPFLCIRVRNYSRRLLFLSYRLRSDVYEF